MSSPLSPDKYVVESPRRLSESQLWQLQREFYTESGPAAWTTGLVPHYITNNTIIADACFRTFYAYLESLCLTHALPDAPDSVATATRHGAPQTIIDPTEPLYVLELGAGTGRFAFQFLNLLQEYAQTEPLTHLKIIYVMADMAPRNVAFWQAHAQLRPFVEKGQLDFATFDAESDSTISLLVSGKELRAQTLHNPLLVLGNYLFDTLRTDAFRVIDGKLHECLVTLYTEQAKDLETERYNYLNILQCHYTYNPTSPDYYENKRWNAILREYEARGWESGFTLPVGGFRCLETLLSIAGQRLMFISSDKAYGHLDEIDELPDPEPIVHGSFSLTVNFHALGRLMELSGGHTWHTRTPEEMLDHIVMLSDPLLPQTSNVALAFEHNLASFSPCDCVMFSQQLEGLQDLPLATILQIVRLNNYDPEVAYAWHEGIVSQVEEASPALQAETTSTLEHVWRNYYHIPNPNDLAFEIARVAYRLDQYARAVRYYEYSLALFGEHKMTFHNIGLAYYADSQLVRAQEYFQKALALDPEYAVAQEWLAITQAKLAGDESS